MRILAVATACLCATACGDVHHVETARRPTAPVLVVAHGRPPAWMLPRARLAARGLGDPRPRKIELFAAGKSYRIRLWGSFRCLACSRPSGAAAPTGGVATFVYRDHTRALSSFSLAPRRLVVAADAVAPVVREWRAELRRGARAEPARRFPSPSLAVLRRRLDLAARRYGFAVVRVELRRPRQLAPQIVLRGPRSAEAARDLGPILDLVDPPARSNDRAYEGILVEAVDPHGVPFAIAWNALRGQVAGGQWAGAPALYPFPHG